MLWGGGLSAHSRSFAVVNTWSHFGTGLCPIVRFRLFDGPGRSTSLVHAARAPVYGGGFAPVSWMGVVPLIVSAAAPVRLGAQTRRMVI